MEYGQKGAIGAALQALGQGVSQYGERNYREELNSKLEKARQARENNLMTRREKFQSGESQKAREFQSTKEAEGRIARAAQAELDRENEEIAAAQLTEEKVVAKDLERGKDTAAKLSEIAYREQLVRGREPKDKKPDIYNAISRKGDDDFIAILDPKTKKFFKQGTDEEVTSDEYKFTRVPSVQVATTADEFGITKKVKSELQKSTITRNKTLGLLKEAISAYEKNPQAAGIFGSVAETMSGLAGQVPGSLGKGIANYLDEGGEITDTRTLGSMITGKLIPTITGDTSGRYSDRDIEWAKKTSKARDPFASSDQVVTALKRIQSIMETESAMDDIFLGWEDDKKPERHKGLFVIDSKSQYDKLSPGTEYFESQEDGSFKRYVRAK